MDPDDLKASWQAQSRPTIDPERILADVRRDDQRFAATLFWRDVREVGVALLLVPVWFLWNNSESVIYIFSKPDQKIRNLKENPNVVLALNSPTGNDVVTLEGTATLLEPDAITTAHPDYEAKYKAHLDQFGWTGESMSHSYTEPIRVEITKVRA